ncbi:hypothetical protein WICPIJ_002353 [Wickerhamomyces pijperi]|uniref:Uncharacterized protein n=1 Tax=Wickerhamomyces pijperi TaxID=599730 RepID=A0A9P8QBW2_WICPI|nr:hypothetical protein WICPIJ_002353 [Wickerhamomyces pijperi]
MIPTKSFILVFGIKANEALIGKLTRLDLDLIVPSAEEVPLIPDELDVVAEDSVDSRDNVEISFNLESMPIDCEFGSNILSILRSVFLFKSPSTKWFKDCKAWLDLFKNRSPSTVAFVV